MPTLAEVRTLLSRYAGANNDFEDRLNLVRARLISDGNWPGTKVRATFTVYPDANHRAVITLPRALNTILAGAVVQPCGDTTGNYAAPIPVRNGWYSFSPNGVGLNLDSRYNWRGGFVPEEGRFTTFADWSTAKYLRLKFAATETNGLVFNIRGNLNGAPVYTGTGSGTIEGENLTTVGATTLTTSSQFDEPPYELFKPVTFGRVSLYTWDGATETLVAIYDPTETVPAWRRYRVPACDAWTLADPGQFTCICKIAYVPVANDRDEVIPGNLGALRFGLEAMTVEDSRSMAEADILWNRAKELLADQVSDDDGYGATGSVQVADDFQLASVGGMT